MRVRIYSGIDFAAWRRAGLEGTRPGLAPYGLEHLASSGLALIPRQPPRWLRGRLQSRVVAERRVAAAPLVQPLQLLRRPEDVALAILEREGLTHALLKRAGVAPWSRVPLVLVSCWLADEVRAASRPRLAVLRALAQEADLIVFWSSNQRAIFRDVLGVPDEPAAVRAVRDRDRLLHPIRGCRAERFVLSVGRDRGRDWETLVAAVNGLSCPVKLVCPPEAVDGLALAPHVELVGEVDHLELRRLLGEASVVALALDPDVAYPTGQTVLLNAMAVGTPVVLTDSPAMRDYARHDENAWVVAPRDPERCGPGSRLCSADAPLAERLRAQRAAGRPRAIQRGGDVADGRERASRSCGAALSARSGFRRSSPSRRLIEAALRGRQPCVHDLRRPSSRLRQADDGLMCPLVSPHLLPARRCVCCAQHWPLRPRLTVVLALLAGSAQAAQVATTWRGAQVHSLWASETTQQMHQDLDAAKQAGANVVRLDVAWATLDSNGPGQLTAWYSQRLSQFMTYANQLNLKVVAIAFTTPCWASSAPDSVKQNCQGDWWSRGVGWYPPTNDAQFGDFVRYLTSTYGSSLAAVEVWNEPDQSNYFVSAHPADDYAQLLKAAYPAAKAGNSAVPVLAGALSGADLSFVQTLYQDGAQGYYDGLSLHSYCDGSPYATGASDPRFEFQAGLEAMHALQSQHGDQAPLWVTEFGWSTLNVSPSDQATVDRPGLPDHGRHALRQGRHRLRTARRHRRRPRRPRVALRPDEPGLHGQAGVHRLLHRDVDARRSVPGSADRRRRGQRLQADAHLQRRSQLDRRRLHRRHRCRHGHRRRFRQRRLHRRPAGFRRSPHGRRDRHRRLRQPRSRLDSSSVIVEPAAPQLTSPRAGAATGSQPTFSFTADPGVTVAVSLDGALLGTTTADASGVASLTAPHAIGYGSHSVSAVASDSIGYSSPASAATSFVVPAPSPTLTAPAPTIVTPRQGSTSDPTVSVQVKGLAGDVATVCVAGKACASAPINPQGLATVSMTHLSAGTHTVKASQHDAAGVTGPAGATVTWTVSGSASGSGSGSAAGSGSTPSASSASAGQRLSLRLAALRSTVVPVTCRVSTGSITRCRVTLYLAGRKIGSGSVLLRAARASATVRVRVTRVAARRLRAAKHGLSVTARASATSGTRALAGATLARVRSPRTR